MNRTQHTLDLLRRFESRNITFIEEGGGWPIVWARARGPRVWDAGGRRYLDLTAAFGVAAAGHANPRVVRAGQRQMAELLHAMGDVHPHARKAELARELSRLTFERWSRPTRGTPGQPRHTGKVIFCNSGFEAVEAALKTAMLATGRPGVIAFEGGYHGLGYGALTATHRAYFRQPFQGQLREFARFLPYPVRHEALAAAEAGVARELKRGAIGAVLIEPVQARGGIRIPPFEFLTGLRALCTEYETLLVVDEVYTGFGRTGRWFACEHSAVLPDLICLGKALTGGFPLSACVGRADVMDTAWPPSQGEALHTSTFLGHPVGCAMALAQVGELRRRRLPDRSARLGAVLLRALQRLDPPAGLRGEARGIGLMAGLALYAADGRPAGELTLALVKNLLHRGFILLPEGEHGNVLGFTPPLTIGERDLERALAALAAALDDLDPQ